MREAKTKTTALPLFLQISEALTREIAAGRLVDGERLPPERQLAEQYGTSVRTLRKALEQLENQKLLDRVQGSGNYVRSSPTVQGVYSMFRLELRGGGGLPTADILAVDHVDKPGDLPAFGTATRANRIRRQRYLDGVSIAVEEIWLDAGAGHVDPETLSDSLYRYYRLQLGFWITRAEDYVSIGTVPDWSPVSFQKSPGTQLGYVERFSWAQAPEPVEFSRTWFDTEKALYVQRLT